MTIYKNHYPYKIMLHNVTDTRPFDKWIKNKEIIGWTWSKLIVKRQIQYTFKNKDDAVLFQLTFG